MNADFMPSRGYIERTSSTKAGVSSLKFAKNVDMSAEKDECNFCLLPVGNAGTGVQGDSIPDQSSLRFGIAVRDEKSSGSISTVDLEALVSTEFFGQPQVVQQGCEIDEFAVVLESALRTEKFCEPPSAMDVIQDRP